MSRIDDILTLARDTLSDPDKNRWSDARLLRVLDKGHKDIAIKTRMLREKTTIPVVAGRSTYTLPDTCYLITHITYDDRSLPVYTHNQLSQMDPIWPGREGAELAAFVLDRMNQRTFKVYPIPTDASVNNTSLPITGGVISGTSHTLLTAYQTLVDAGAALDPSILTELTVSDAQYGVAVDVEGYDVSSIYGVVTDIVANDTNIIGESVFGVVTDAYDSQSGSINVYYIAKPTTITATTDELLIDESFDLALKYFVTSTVLRDDVDSRSVELAASESALYDREFAEAAKLDYRDSGRTGLLSTPYFDGFNTDSVATVDRYNSRGRIS